MSNCESDMSFDSTVYVDSECNESVCSDTISIIKPIDSDGSISDEEYKEYIEAKERTIRNKDIIAEKVRTAKPYKRQVGSDVVYFDGIPYVLSNGRYIRVLATFNYITDLSLWVSKQNSHNDFDEWLSVPRSSRTPYSPILKILGVKSMFSGESYDYRSLLVKNLSSKTTGFQLREIFSRYGYIRDVYIPINHCTGEKCNYAFIEIHPFVEMDVILSEMATFSILNGRPMQVQIAISGRRTATEMRTRYSDTKYSMSAYTNQKIQPKTNGRFNIVY